MKVVTSVFAALACVFLASQAHQASPSEGEENESNVMYVEDIFDSSIEDRRCGEL